jgi:hypothetical protein
VEVTVDRKRGRSINGEEGEELMAPLKEDERFSMECDDKGGVEEWAKVMSLWTGERRGTVVFFTREETCDDICSR